MASDDRQAGAGPSAGRAGRHQSGVSLGRLLSDRRGATAPAFGVMVLVVFGMAGLATEAGRWYDIRRDAQNAADVAALAGAIRLQYAAGALNQTCNAVGNCAGPKSQGEEAARGVATLNGFTNNVANTFVQATSPPTMGAYMGNPRAVEVIITRNQQRSFSRLLTGATSDQEIFARGVAATFTAGNACVLGLSDPAGEGGVTFSGGGTLNAAGCIIASNAPTSDSLRVNGNASTIIAANFNSLGGCYNCSGGNNPTSISLSDGPPVTGIATPDPYTWVPGVLRNPPSTAVPTSSTNVSSFVQPDFQGGQAPNYYILSPVRNASWTWVDSGGVSRNPPYYLLRETRGQGNISVGSGQTLLLKPGVYFFLDGTGLSLTSTANLCAVPADYTGTTCPAASNAIRSDLGVTLVFLRGTATNAGTVSITGTGTVQLQAPSTTFYCQTTGSPPVVDTSTNCPNPYRGMVVYREPSATSQLDANRGGGNGQVTIVGSTSDSRLSGAIYAPLASVSTGGNADLDRQGCLVIVAGEVLLTGSSQVSAANCESGFGNASVPQTRVVRLLE